MEEAKSIKELEREISNLRFQAEQDKLKIQALTRDRDWFNSLAEKRFEFWNEAASKAVGLEKENRDLMDKLALKENAGARQKDPELQRLGHLVREALKIIEENLK